MGVEGVGGRDRRTDGQIEEKTGRGGEAGIDEGKEEG